MGIINREQLELQRELRIAILQALAEQGTEYARVHIDPGKSRAYLRIDVWTFEEDKLLPKRRDELNVERQLEKAQDGLG